MFVRRLTRIAQFSSIPTPTPTPLLGRVVRLEENGDVVLRLRRGKRFSGEETAVLRACDVVSDVSVGSVRVVYDVGSVGPGDGEKYVSLRAGGKKSDRDNEFALSRLLKRNGGYLEGVWDGMDVEMCRKELNMSRTQLRRAIGRLLRRKEVVQVAGGLAQVPSSLVRAGNALLLGPGGPEGGLVREKARGRRKRLEKERRRNAAMLSGRMYGMLGEDESEEESGMEEGRRMLDGGSGPRAERWQAWEKLIEGGVRIGDEEKEEGSRDGEKRKKKGKGRRWPMKKRREVELEHAVDRKPDPDLDYFLRLQDRVGGVDDLVVELEKEDPKHLLPHERKKLKKATRRPAHPHPSLPTPPPEEPAPPKTLPWSTEDDSERT